MGKAFIALLACLIAITLMYYLQPAQDASLSTMLQEVRGRHLNNGQRPYIYRLSVPKEWHYASCDPSTAILDSTQPLALIKTNDPQEQLTISIYNFPLVVGMQSIPPQQQIERWLRQLSADNGSIYHEITPVNFSGYQGLQVIAEAHQKGLLAWSLVVAEEQRESLLSLAFGPQQKSMEERAGDVTIKVTGPSHLISRWRNELETLATSFEQIEEIPSWQ